jgi:plasmid stabilization system protein ParE
VTLEWAHMAESDMDEILYYIAEDNVERAISFTGELRAEARKLLNFPKMGVPLTSDSENDRALFYKGYTIAYEIRDAVILVTEVYNQAKQNTRTKRI